MHRHGYRGRKFGRERDQRTALMKGLATSLVEYETIETTYAKAKELVPYIEKLITKAKKGGLHNYRQVQGGLSTKEATDKLVNEIAPKLAGRTSGHVRVTRTRTRVGDNAQLATIEFVDDLSVQIPPVKEEVEAVAEEKAPVKETVKKAAPTKKAETKKEDK